MSIIYYRFFIFEKAISALEQSPHLINASNREVERRAFELKDFGIFN